MRDQGESFAKKYSAISGCAPAHNFLTNDRGMTHVPDAFAHADGRTSDSGFASVPAELLAASCESDGVVSAVGSESCVAVVSGLVGGVVEEVDAPAQPTNPMKSTYGNLDMARDETAADV